MTYPLRFPDDDPRFSSALIDEISATLIAHGYPWTEGDDTAFTDLRAALAGFLYGPEFNNGDEVVWFRKGKVWSGRVEYVASTDKGPVARIRPEKQPGSMGAPGPTVVPCRELTLVRDGAK